MWLNIVFGALAALSLALTLWQWLVARRFPLHQRKSTSFAPDVSLLKPLKGCDEETERCLRSWFEQDYAGRIQILFGVASGQDPVCPVVEKLLAEFPACDARLVLCDPNLGANAKVSSLVQIERLATYEIVVVSDADVRVPRDFLTQATAPLQKSSVGLVNCFYAMAHPTTLAMRWEAVAVNADFWSQVLQSRSMKPLDFALGAVMATRRRQLREIGGFKALLDFLADDYQLGHKIARKGYTIALAPVAVECWSSGQGWADVWAHQLRWSRTIRVCQPAPYFFSILSNATLWPVLWFAGSPSQASLAALGVCLAARVLTGLDNQRRLTGKTDHFAFFWLIPLKDVLGLLLWAASFFGNRVNWRGQVFEVMKSGELRKVT